ncbi:hypothetical protein K461DRAFT_140501 [Myriangium duriaei CBS 260.36]|uniref:NB-ARC domain-containing protein n=1 Tax=Myriangium duriaei CBS 260.36 TaxID=1168546 RepID=A0A9P4J3J4_9PEZI|nr:hypothetical protein K461DRAFT_140501 [Myriangium duriaei CBS 260.36]
MPPLTHLFRRRKSATGQTPNSSSAAISIGGSGSSTQHPQGVHVEAEGTDPVIDIVAIHGLNGHRDKTWTATNGVNWLRDLFPLDLPNARIMSWGYDANTHTAGQVSCQYLYDHARNLVSDLCMERQLTKTERRPIIFIAHSLGGIVVKSALIHSDAARKDALAEHRSITLSTIGIIFMGTPHQGGNGVALGTSLTNIASIFVATSDRLLQHLERDSEWLQQQLGQYAPISSSFITKFAFEEYPTKTVLGHSIMVVPRASAIVPGMADGESIVIPADHIHMVKFASKSDTGYRKISGHARLIAERAVVEIENRWETHNKIVDALSIGHAVHHIIPFTRNPNFIGRVTALAELQQRLFLRRDCQRLAIVGLGGIGKTQVALQLAYWAKDNQPDHSILWLSAMSAESFRQGCQDIVNRLPIAKVFDQDDPRDLVRRHLSSIKMNRYLLVIDNADDMELFFGSSGTCLSAFLPAHDNGLTVFTTRHEEAAASLAGNNVLELGKLNLHEGRELLKKSLRHVNRASERETEASTLLEQLDFHPLAITQAVAYLNIHRIQITEYLQLLQSTPHDLVSLISREFQDNTRYPSSRNAIATTWLVSFDQIRKLKSSAADLLCLISRIEFRAIPRSLLVRSSEEETTFAIGTLQSYAFIVRQGSSDLYDMHRLVHLAAAIWADKNAMSTSISEKAVQHMATIFPDHKTDLWQQCLPHAIRLVSNQEVHDTSDRNSLCFTIGLGLFLNARYRESLSWLSEVYEWRKQRLEENDPDLLESTKRLARALEQNGYLMRSVKMMESVIEIEERAFNGASHSSQHHLGVLYMANGQTQDAIKTFQRLIHAEKLTKPEHDRHLLETQHMLAMTYHHSGGQVLDAIRLLEHVVNIRKRCLSQEHPNRLASEQELAKAYH